VTSPVPVIAVEYVPGGEDLAARKALARRTFKWRKLVWLLPSMIAFGVLFAWFDRHARPGATGSLIAVWASVAVSSVTVWRANRIARGAKGPVERRVTTDGIEVRNPDDTGFASWSTMTGALETSTHFVFACGSLGMVEIPKRLLGAGEAERIRVLAQGQLRLPR